MKPGDVVCLGDSRVMLISSFIDKDGHEWWWVKYPRDRRGVNTSKKEGLRLVSAALLEASDDER